jgi:hypothetical protein
MRINNYYAYIYIMKSRLNLTIEESLLKSMKIYAEKQHTSVSDLVENYFKQVIKPSKRESFVDMVEKLEPSNIDPKVDLKEQYYLNKKNGN